MRTFITILLLFPFLLSAQIVIEDDGKIGIGTETPTYEIQLFSDNIRIGGDANRDGWRIGGWSNSNHVGIGNAFINNINHYALLQKYSGETFLNSNKNVNFRINNNTKMRLISNGNFGIGTNAPNEILDVNGNIKCVTLIESMPPNTLKHNKTKYNKGLAEVLQLNPIQYSYQNQSDEKYLEEVNHISLDAKNTQKILPELIQEITYQEIDEDDKLISEENRFQIVASDIKYLLINAIKEQQEIIIDLQDQIDDLKISDIEIEAKEISLNFNSLKPILLQNRPNPNNGQTIIEYSIPENFGKARIIFFAMNGELIKEEIIADTGFQSLRVNTKNLSHGRYTYSLEVDGKIIDTKSMIVVD